MKTILEPESSFIQKVSIENNEAVITFKGREGIYHYQISPEITDMLTKEDSGLTVGQVFNQFIKPKLLFKTA